MVREVVVFDYRGAVPDTGASTVTRLGEAPLGARDALLAKLDAPVARPAAPPLGEVEAPSPARAGA
jgi:hypothetical protein